MIRRGVTALLLFVTLALAGRPASAQRGAAYCRITEIKSEQLSNGVRVTIVADGELHWDIDFNRLVAEGAIVIEQTPWGESDRPTERFTRLPVKIFNARSLLGSGFVAINKYPISHAEIRIPDWAVEGVGLNIDVVNYLGWTTGEGDQFRGRYQLWIYDSEDRRSMVVAWVSDRFPPPPPPATPADLPSEVKVSSGPAGLTVRAVNAKLADVANAIAGATGFPVSTPADSETRVSLTLRDLSANRAIEAIAAGCGLCAGQRPDGSWVLAAGVSSSGGYEVAATRRIPLRHLRAVDALDLLPNFLLQYFHADREGNAIIVTGPDWMCERVAADLSKLDVPPPEVVLDVVAVEYISTTALARALRLERFLGDVNTALDTLTGDLSFLWLPGLTSEWNVVLDNLGVESDVRLRSRATVRVLNSHTSRIFGGQQRTITVQQFQRFEEVVQPTLLTLDVGTSLQLQPRLGTGDEVVLHITLNVNTLSGFDPTSGLPDLSLRSAEATARVKDGETVAIAGLRLLEESRQVRRLPLLSDLPLLGGLFRAPSRSRSERQLAIFVTPHLLRTKTAGQGATAHG